MRTTILTLACTCLTALFALSCTTTPEKGTGLEVKVQDPCLANCGALFTRCTESSPGAMTACNQDRAACEAECRADEAEAGATGEGVITEE